MELAFNQIKVLIVVSSSDQMLEAKINQSWIRFAINVATSKDDHWLLLIVTQSALRNNDGVLFAIFDQMWIFFTASYCWFIIFEVEGL